MPEGEATKADVVEREPSTETKTSERELTSRAEPKAQLPTAETTKRGFIFDLTDEIENNANIHRRLIAQIEMKTDRNLICYLANPGHPAAAIQDHDPDILENVLRSMDLERFDRKLDILLASPGGFPYAAGKMVKVCRSFSKDFRAIVITRAMSAGTLLCLGAHELVMADTASLGPIDPQMIQASGGGQRLVPASVLIETFKQMLGSAQAAIAQQQPPDPYFHVLDSLDVTAVFESLKAVDSTKAIAKDLLKDGLLRNNPGSIDRVVQALMTEGEKELHGKHLYPPVLQADPINLPVTVLPLNETLDTMLRELSVRLEMYATSKAIAKYYVSRQGGIDVNLMLQVVQARR